MTTLISKHLEAHSHIEAEEDLRETNPLPIALIGVAALLLGDVALTLAAIAAKG